MTSRKENFVRVVCPDSHGNHIDPDAKKAFLGDLKILTPDELVHVGDCIDAGGTFSAHQRTYTNEMVESYEDDCYAANQLWDGIARYVSGPKWLIEGNHEQHVERWVSRTFQSHKDAVALLEKYGPEVMLRLKSRGIKYIKRSEFYMGLSIPGAIRLGHCCFVHGISHSKHCASTHLARFNYNVVFGHVHTPQMAAERTVMSAGFSAWCPGTLAKLQPLYKHTAPSSWSHGYLVQFVNRSGQFLTVPVPIHKGKSLLMDVARRV